MRRPFSVSSMLRIAKDQVTVCNRIVEIRAEIKTLTPTTLAQHHSQLVRVMKARRVLIPNKRTREKAKRDARVKLRRLKQEVTRLQRRLKRWGLDRNDYFTIPRLFED